MKICRVSNSYPSESSPGSGLTPYYLCKYIYHPTLYITKAIESGKRRAPDHIVLKEIRYRDKRSPDNIRNQLHAVRIGTMQEILTHLKVMKTLRSVSFFIRSVPALVKFRPDIIGCHQSLTLLHGVFAKLFLGSKFVFHIHNNSEIVVINNLWLLKVLVRRADLILCLSQEMGKQIETVIPSAAKKVRYTSTGVYPELFKNKGKERKNQLLAIAHFRWEKGYTYLLDAVSRVFNQHPDYSLIIVGDGPEKEAIVKRIENLGISDKVKLEGVVSRQRVMELLNESRIFVMSSLSEGLPKVLLEALSCGTPAVITTGCNADDIIQGRGLSVETRNSQALAEAINKLI